MPADPLLTSVTRRCRAVVLVCFAGVALIGGPVTPPALAWGLAPLLGLAAAGVAAAVAAVRGGGSAGRWALGWGAGVAAVLPFVHGVDLLGQVGGAVSLVMLVAGALATSCTIVAWAEATDPEATDPEAGDPGATELVAPDPAAVRLLPTEEILATWRQTRVAPSDGPTPQARAAALRSVLLDELARRDPEGTARWLRCGGDSPDRFFPDQRHDRAG